MVFSSLVFLWIFLPITIIGYYVVKDQFKNVLLLLASLLFYAWGEPVYILLMLFSIVVNWIIGLLMERFVSWKKAWLVLGIVINIALLGYFKYFNFFMEIINRCFHKSIEINVIELPIGISFYTFQILSYVIDLYRGEYKAQKSVINLALYISFFPQLIAGPIVKYKDINEQLLNRTTSLEKMAQGVRRFIYGLGKKVVIANTLAQCVDHIYGLEAADLTGWLAWVAAIFYSLQIYFDFSGYSDMAIGLGKIFGFEFQENFNYPYIASSIQEFWQRWHISLGTWFREYVYIPLGGNRKGSVRTYCNLAIVFFVTGLWHGAGFNFIWWGLYHGFFSIIERMGLRKILNKHKLAAHVYALLIVNFGWVLFRAQDLKTAGFFIGHMLVPWRFVDTSAGWQRFFENRTIAIAVVGILGCGIIQFIGRKCGIDRKWRYSYLELGYCAVVFILCIAMLASNTYNPFIYFRF